MLNSRPRQTGSKRTQIREQVRQLIDGKAEGEPIPSERDLSEQLGVSRPTLRSAVDDLVGAGLLVRRHGRGTFIRHAPASPQALAPATGAEELRAAAGSGHSSVCTFETQLAGALLGERMRVSPASPLLHVVRLRIAGEAPIAIERIWIPQALVPDIRPEDFGSESVHELLRVRYGVLATETVQIAKATVAEAAEADQLQIPVQAPALLVTRTTEDGTGQVIEYTRSVYRGDRYHITSHLHWNNNSG
jgi:GntR family transcriptional regulator